VGGTSLSFEADGTAIKGFAPSSYFLHFVRFQVLTAANVKMTVFWDVALCSLILYRCVTGAYCVHHQGDIRRHVIITHIKYSRLFFPSVFIARNKATDSEFVSLS
jgi:hypothetical protein